MTNTILFFSDVLSIL